MGTLLRVKGVPINNFPGKKDVNWDCPRQTKDISHTNFRK
jgi:hypothetical protein